MENMENKIQTTELSPREEYHQEFLPQVHKIGATTTLHNRIHHSYFPGERLKSLLHVHLLLQQTSYLRFRGKHR